MNQTKKPPGLVALERQMWGFRLGNAIVTAFTAAKGNWAGVAGAVTLYVCFEITHQSFLRRRR